MSEMIVKVARILAIQIGSGTHYDSLTLSDQSRVRDVARYAIEAMRIPTMSMKEAGCVSIPCDEPCALDAQHIWTAMIDAALKNPTPSPP